MLALAAIPLSAADFGYEVPAATAVYVLPPAGSLATATAWVQSNAYVSGARVLARGEPYFCVLPGTSSATAVGATNFVSAQVVDDTVTWIRPLSRLRQGFAITVSSAGNVYVSYGSLASAGKGLWLAAGVPYQLSNDTGFQGAVSLYSTSTVTVTGMEW